MRDYKPEEGLSAFLDDGLITDVVRMVRSGKEATVFCCVGSDAVGGALVAAKVYRPRKYRNFNDDGAYQDGRYRAMARREQLAIRKKSGIGRDIQFASWINAEFSTLRELYAAGASVPAPYSCSDTALLMEFIGDRDADAPMLSRVRMERAEGERCIRAIVENVATMLAYHRVHGDLSAYNILYRDSRPVIIDFPQAVDARFNPNARALLERDLENVCGYFSKIGISIDARRIAAEMWRRYQVGEL
jgi:RIO kinase 1